MFATCSQSLVKPFQSGAVVQLQVRHGTAVGCVLQRIIFQVWDSLYEEAELLPGMAVEDARLLPPAGIAAKAAKLKEEVRLTMN